MGEESGSAYRAIELLQIAATVAAIALALATLVPARGPEIRGVHLIPATLLFAGFIAVLSSGYAVAALHTELQLTQRDLFKVFQPRPHYQNAVIVATWALIVLGAGYFWVMIDNASA